jgi:uncharacterized protein (DUF1330 family)
MLSVRYWKYRRKFIFSACDHRPAKERLLKGYIVFTREKTLDPSELAIYWDKIRGTFAGHEVKVLAAYGKHEVLEGHETEGVVIAEFPTFEAAKTWYDSVAYREVRKHRQKGAVYRGILVEGV